MLRRCCLLLVMVFGLMGCYKPSLTASNSSLMSSYKKITQTRQLAPYNQVVVKGRLNVSLHTGYRHPQVILTGDGRDLAQVVTNIKNNTLFISMTGKARPYYAEVAVEIRTHDLNSFTYDGVGVISGSQLNTRYLNLSITNPKNQLYFLIFFVVVD